MSDQKEVRIINMIELLSELGESDSNLSKMIIAFVEQQSQISLSHGLSLSDDQKAREVKVLMKFVRENGGLEGVKKQVFAESVQMLGEMFNEEFAADRKEFFDNWRPGMTSTRMAYGAHLYSMTGGFLNRVFNDLI